jgi:hypothetical protein
MVIERNRNWDLGVYKNSNLAQLSIGFGAAVFVSRWLDWTNSYAQPHTN